jgi:GNAT superfamily N-acetyltransferase
VIRAAARADLDRVVDAVVRLAENGAAADPRYVLADDTRARLRSLFAEQWFGAFLPFPACLVDEREGRLVGLVSAEIAPPHPILPTAPGIRIDNLWVEPDHRRQGVGRALVAEMRRRADAAGYARHGVSTLARDERAVAFWRSVGFDPFTVTLLAT